MLLADPQIQGREKENTQKEGEKEYIHGNYQRKPRENSLYIVRMHTFMET